MNEYTDRYLAYCRIHETTPESMLEHDAARWPGGKMAGFILWIGAQWTAWATARGIKNHQTYPKSDDDHADFDRFLGALHTIGTTP